MRDLTWSRDMLLRFQSKGKLFEAKLEMILTDFPLAVFVFHHMRCPGCARGGGLGCREERAPCLFLLLW